MKALRDLGSLLVVLLGLLWLGAEPQTTLSQVENGTLTSAQWVMPPFPDAVLEQKPAVQWLQQLPGFSHLRSPSQLRTADWPLVQLGAYTANKLQLCLHGQLQQLHRVRLYPFHEFG
ncbi:MAG: hypothetical protein C0424_01355 [Sphingobacteriaceae bacterium]|nr:hypothetical protein [Sphingobacteriaceae bacterium]